MPCQRASISIPSLSVSIFKSTSLFVHLCDSLACRRLYPTPRPHQPVPHLAPRFPFEAQYVVEAKSWRPRAQADLEAPTIIALETAGGEELAKCVTASSL